VSGSHNTIIQVWDANTGAEMLPPLLGHDASVASVAFSHDGSTIVSGSDEDDTIRIWDANTGAEKLPPLAFQRRTHASYITSVAFSRDGFKIVSKFSDYSIRIWNSSTRAEIDFESVLPCQRGTPAACSNLSMPDAPMISCDSGGWFKSDTGAYLGRLPVGNSCYCRETGRSHFVGWTSDHKLIILCFPVVT
jgi:WD40 repeat protein